MGHDVEAMCWVQGIEGEISFVPPRATGRWQGMRELSYVHASQGLSDEDICREITRQASASDPDVIIVGNLHGADWPLELLLHLRELDALVIAYMHDCYAITGRCAYPGPCQLFKTGCDETCPTADQYPVLAPANIPAAWRLRRKIFCGGDGVFLATNSLWTLSMAKEGLVQPRHADVVYYGLDQTLFKPIEKRLARRLLGIEENRFVILGGAVNLNEQRKGAPIYREIVSALNKEALFITFGENSDCTKGVRATGLLRDYRKMPLLYSAADIFVGAALEEAFGLTLCEAAACATPVVAAPVGGVPEVAMHERNARLVNGNGVSAFIKEIDFFMRDRNARIRYGLAGRALVEQEFTLERQGQRWVDYIRMCC
jgi:glycosyltransferase involved in cell wall biosynthesis